MEFKKYKLKQIGTIITGCTPATKERDFYSSSDFLFVGPSDIKTSKYIYKTDKNISFEAYAKYKTRFIPKNSIMVDCIGSDMGNVAIASKECLTNQQINSICIIDNENFNFEYIYYVLSTMKSHFHTIGFNGSTMPIINKSLFENIEIKLPPKKVQDRIVNVLSHIDKKIELNNQINENLKKLSQELYKRWFIDFEFPNEEGNPYKSSGGEMIESELGDIPKGWELKKLGEIVNIKYGKNLPTKKLLTHGNDVYGGNGVIGKYNEIMYKEPQVLISCRGAASGKVMISGYNIFVTNNSLILETERKKYFYIKEMSLNKSYYEYVTGSAQPQITINNIKDISIINPKEEILLLFNKILSKIEDEYFSLILEKQSLEFLRDTLLPKLLNGKINLDSIEIGD